MQIIICKKGHKRTEGEKCPICIYGQPGKEPFSNHKPSEYRPGRGAGGGPKKKQHQCKNCGFKGFVRRSPYGNSSNCTNCGKRF